MLLKILNNGVFFMKKFGRDRIALFLTCMSVLGSRTSAMNTNKAQNPQSVAAVRGVTSRNDQFVKQGLTKNQKLGIGAAITALVAVPAVALTIWGIKKHKNNDQDHQEKSKKAEKINNNKTDENKNEKLLDSFIEFSNNGFESYFSSEDGRLMQIDDKVRKNINGFIKLVSGLCKCIKNNKFGNENLKELQEGFSNLKFQYTGDKTIELEVLVNENNSNRSLKVTITKLDSGFELKQDSGGSCNTLILQSK